MLDENRAQLPVVSILIPMRNEERYIAQCLESILANDYPKDRLEILVIDGMSTDRSREIVQDYAKHYPFLRLLDNPKRIQSAALNIGIRESKGKIIIRMDAHTLYASDYIRRCVELLETTEAANVGGLQRAMGTGYISNAIAIATTTPFGIGNAYFRYAEKEMWVDTVYLGAWRKSTLEALGGFNEDWVVNEDYELNYRLRKAGGKILLSPEIKCWYYVRPSLKALARQYFRYGFWRVKTLVAYPDSLRWRQLAPPTLVIALLLSLGILPINWMLGITVPALYLVANLVASIWTASRKGWKYLPLLPVVFAIIHLSWGTGFLAGLFKWGIPRFTLRSLAKAFQSPDKV
ncbi:MAG: glycosyltransferase family 2 protein [Candidatus Methanomethylicaceae archaeon]